MSNPTLPAGWQIVREPSEGIAPPAIRIINPQGTGVWVCHDGQWDEVILWHFLNAMLDSVPSGTSELEETKTTTPESAVFRKAMEVAKRWRYSGGTFGGHFTERDVDTLVAAILDAPLGDAVISAGDFAAIVTEGIAEARHAMVKFKQPNYVITKLAEEAGEVVKEAVHCAEGRGNFYNLQREIAQLIAMIYRLWEEGDQVHGLPPVGDHAQHRFVRAQQQEGEGDDA